MLWALVKYCILIDLLTLSESMRMWRMLRISNSVIFNFAEFWIILQMQFWLCCHFRDLEIGFKMDCIKTLCDCHSSSRSLNLCLILNSKIISVVSGFSYVVSGFTVGSYFTKKTNSSWFVSCQTFLLPLLSLLHYRIGCVTSLSICTKYLYSIM